MSGERKRALEAILALGDSGPICPECLGRTFAKRGKGLTNEARGRALRLLLALDGREERPGVCWICQDAFRTLDRWVDEAAERVGGIEFSTYLFGARLSARLAEMESFVNERFGIGTAESMKHSFNRALGLRFDERFPETTVAFKNPDVSFLVDLESETLSVHVASIYLLGRYRKLARGIPQTKWPCRRCRGRGCDVCGGTGLQYQESVEGWIASAFVEASQADGARFHGAGREDIDARMLGSGRPFVLELLSPKRRSLDLVMLSQEANRRAAGRVETTPLVPVDRAMVERVKETKARKRYRALVSFEQEISESLLGDAIRFLAGTISQRTPQRVAHRRSDKVRMRRLFEITGRLLSPREAELELETEGGLYVKELVSGDDGRSEPSLSGRLGVQARVTELDVLHVDWSGDEPGVMDLP